MQNTFPDQPTNLDDMHHEALMQIEALIFASDTPVTIARIKQALGDHFSSSQIRQLLQQLALLQHGRSVELIETCLLYTSPSPRD